jgi:cysteine-S-conjugate beta-lyase
MSRRTIGGPWHGALLRDLEANRDHLTDSMRRELPGVTMATPEGKYLAWLDCRGAGLTDPFAFFVETATPRALLTEALEQRPR